jgi:hypothetical protein
MALPAAWTQESEVLATAAGAALCLWATPKASKGALSGRDGLIRPLGARFDGCTTGSSRCTRREIRARRRSP